MQHGEEDLLNLTTKRTPLLAMKGLLPETKTIRMKMSVILMALLLVCLVFLGFRYWTVYQLSDRYQRRIAFLERSMYRSSQDGDVAEAREHDFQKELKRQKDKLLQMDGLMNMELAKLRSKCQLETEQLMHTVDSKNEIIKQNEEFFLRLKKDYKQLQHNIANFQVNQTQLLEQFTTQSVRVEMLLKLKDTCYAQMRSLGQRVSIPTSLGKAVPAQEGPGDIALSRGSPVAGTPARESPGKAVPTRESINKLAPARESPGKAMPNRESINKLAPARESPRKESPIEVTPASPSAVVETPAQKSPRKGLPAQESPHEGGQSTEIKGPGEKEAKAARAPALKPAGPRFPARPPKLEAEPDDMPPHPDQPEAKERNHGTEGMAAPAPALEPSRTWDQPLRKGIERKDETLEKSDTVVQKQKKVASGAPVQKEEEDALPPYKEELNAPADRAANSPANKILPDSQPKKHQNNEEKKEEEEERLDYVI